MTFRTVVHLTAPVFTFGYQRRFCGLLELQPKNPESEVERNAAAGMFQIVNESATFIFSMEPANLTMGSFRISMVASAGNVTVVNTVLGMIICHLSRHPNALSESTRFDVTGITVLDGEAGQLQLTA